jgi:hypothetical protein
LSWTYIKTELQLWTVGEYGPDGKFEPESDHGSPDEAAKRVRYLNGGADETADAELQALRSRASSLEAENERIAAELAETRMRLHDAREALSNPALRHKAFEEWKRIHPREFQSLLRHESTAAGALADLKNLPAGPDGGWTGVETEFAVFWGGPSPADCAGWELAEDEAEALEDAAWRVTGGVAKRMILQSAWIVTQEPVTEDEDDAERVTS